MASRLAGDGSPVLFPVPSESVNFKIMEKPAVVVLYLAPFVFELGGNLGKVFFQPNSKHPREKPKVFSSLGLLMGSEYDLP